MASILLKQARRMMKGPEIKAGISPFDCHDWQKRAEAKRKKQIKQRQDKIKRDKSKIKS